MEKVHVLNTLRFTDDLLDQIRAISSRLRMSQQTCHDVDEVGAALAAHPEIEVLYTFHVPHDALELAPRLRWVQLHSAGVNHILDHPIMERDVAITTVSGIHATPIAEYVFASLLAFRWRVPLWTQCQREGWWPSNRWNLYARPELRGSKLGIVGYGSIGREVGRLGQAFGMQVLALHRSASHTQEGYRVEETGDEATEDGAEVESEGSEESEEADEPTKDETPEKETPAPEEKKPVGKKKPTLVKRT